MCGIGGSYGVAWYYFGKMDKQDNVLKKVMFECAIYSGNKI
jgi:hypothetical protein